MDKSKTHLSVAYKRLTLDLKTHVDWKCRDGNRYTVPIEAKKERKSQGGNTKYKTITRDQKGIT